MAEVLPRCSGGDDVSPCDFSAPLRSSELDELRDDQEKDLVLTTFVEALRELLEAQRAWRRETEMRWVALEECGDQLAAKFNAMCEDATRLELRQSPPVSKHVFETANKFTEAHQDDRQKGGTHVRRTSLETRVFDAINGSGLSSKSKDESDPKVPTRSASDIIAIADAEEAAAAAAIMSMQPKSCRERIADMVRSTHFDLFVGVLIVVNTVSVSLNLEYRGRVVEHDLFGLCDSCSVRWPALEKMFGFLEHAFTALFFVELFVRVFAGGFRYLRSFANLVDAFIVVVSSIDSWILMHVGTDSMRNIGILRLVRFVRLSKVLHVVRVMKAFKSLRVLVSAVVASIGALAWSMTLLFVLELIGALFLAQVLQPIIENSNEDHELRVFLWRRFGTWARAMLTIFEITMAPGGFLQYRTLYDDVSPLLGLFFVVYVCVVTFAVVRVITAMFLKATLAASDQDDVCTAKLRQVRREEYVQRLKAHLVGSDCVGLLDKREFLQILRTPNMQEWLEDVKLSRPASLRLFYALERADGFVRIEDFLSVLSQMKGSPKVSDEVVMLHEIWNILRRVRRIEKLVSKEDAARLDDIDLACGLSDDDSSHEDADAETK